MNIFQFLKKSSQNLHHLNTEEIDKFKSLACLIDYELYLEEGKWLKWKDIQLSEIDVSALKNCYGDHVSFSVQFVGKILIKAGVSQQDVSFTWCGEKTFESQHASAGTFDIDLSNVHGGILEITIYAIDESLIFGEDFLREAVQTKIQPEQILYTFLSPTYDLCCEEPLYYKFAGEKCYYSFEDGNVYLKKNSSVDLLTYFNAFSVEKWKKYTNVEQFSAYLDFQGEATAEAVHVSDSGSCVITAWHLKTDQRSTCQLPLAYCPDTGIIGIRIHAEDDFILYGGGYLTDAPTTQEVRLGIGITTYQREESVKKSVAKLGKAIAAHPLYQDAVEITVVDNGKTLAPEALPDATLIPNPNLGGTGGFMRSLVHYQKEGRCTHCLFMDDDARCEAGSLFRAISFIRHAKEPNTALTGGMLYENLQFLQWENGAWFDGGCKALHHNLDLREAENLLKNEEESSHQIYGAWWFFLFPINAVKHYSLPFFVRGDDIDFSYSNDFRIVSLNGVSCWQEDFKSKESAMTVYLFIRSHIVHHLTIPRIKGPFKTIWKMLKSHFDAYNNSYFYGTAACMNLAIRHVLRGPDFWDKNIIPTEILKEIKSLSVCEQSVPYEEDELEELVLADKNLKTSLFPAFLRKASLNGHLLPSFMVHKTPRAMLFKWMTPNRNRVYMRNQVIVVDRASRKKIVLRRNVFQYFKNLCTFLGLMLTTFLRYKQLNKAYSKGAKVQRTEEYWLKQFNRS